MNENFFVHSGVFIALPAIWLDVSDETSKCPSYYQSDAMINVHIKNPETTEN